MNFQFLTALNELVYIKQQWSFLFWFCLLQHCSKECRLLASDSLKAVSVSSILNYISDVWNHFHRFFCWIHSITKTMAESRMVFKEIQIFNFFFFWELSLTFLVFFSNSSWIACVLMNFVDFLFDETCGIQVPWPLREQVISSVLNRSSCTTCTTNTKMCFFKIWLLLG